MQPASLRRPLVNMFWPFTVLNSFNCFSTTLLATSYSCFVLNVFGFGTLIPSLSIVGSTRLLKSSTSFLYCSTFSFPIPAFLIPPIECIILNARGNVNTHEILSTKPFAAVPIFWSLSAFLTFMPSSTSRGAININAPSLPPPNVNPRCIICMALDINLPVPVFAPSDILWSLLKISSHPTVLSKGLVRGPIQL